MNTSTSNYTTAPIEPPSKNANLIPPDFIRLPLPGARCRFTGLSRSTLNELTIPSPANDNRPEVKSVLLRKRGSARGIRLISYCSLISYPRLIPLLLR